MIVVLMQFIIFTDFSLQKNPSSCQFVHNFLKLCRKFVEDCMSGHTVSDQMSVSFGALSLAES